MGAQPPLQNPLEEVMKPTYARGAGATILSEPKEDENGKQYRAEDIEGHRWMFMERQ
jgi:uncharacterized glyoxalase superfamily protein PhnB